MSVGTIVQSLQITYQDHFLHLCQDGHHYNFKNLPWYLYSNLNTTIASQMFLLWISYCCCTINPLGVLLQGVTLQSATYCLMKTISVWATMSFGVHFISKTHFWGGQNINAFTYLIEGLERICKLWLAQTLVMDSCFWNSSSNTDHHHSIKVAIYFRTHNKQ